MGLTKYLDEVFARGMEVEAKGWLVEDYTHDSKTELHPLISQIGDRNPRTGVGTGDNFGVYVAVDRSERFEVSQSLREYFSFPLNAISDVKRPDKGYQGEDAEIEVVEETAGLDLLPTPSFSTPQARRSTARLSFSADYGDERFGILFISGVAHEPAYLAGFSRTLKKFFHDEVKYEVIPFNKKGPEKFIHNGEGEAEWFRW